MYGIMWVVSYQVLKRANTILDLSCTVAIWHGHAKLINSFMQNVCHWTPSLKLTAMYVATYKLWITKTAE